MKKVLVLCLSLFLLVGCSCSLKSTPTKAVEDTLKRYKSNDTTIMDELDTYVDSQDLTDEQKKSYREVLVKQYTDLKYEVTDEKIDGDTAVVDTKITVYDLYKVQKDAEDYLTKHKDEFYDDNKTYDKNLYIDYKLKKMKENTSTVDYTITLNLTKENNKWVVDQIDSDSLEKIHGIYNYEMD